MSVNKNANIAIIGAGVSGIFTALELQKAGFENITLYEKAERIVSLTTTFTHQNKNFDLSTKLIPSIGLLNDGVYPPLMELITSTDLTLQATSIPKFYDFEQNRHMVLPALMQKFKKIKIIRDFTKAYYLLLKINQCRSLVEIYKTGIVKEEESIDDWATRHNIIAFGAFTNYLIDLFNMGPSADVPAGFALVSRVHFVAPYLHSTLSKFGVRHFLKLITPGTKKEFRRFLDFKSQTTNYYVIKEGYEEFFRRIVKQHNLRIECNSVISNLKKDSNGLTFEVNGVKTINCDKLIFCCPPMAISGMSYLPEARQLLQDILPGRIIRTWGVGVNHWDEAKFGKSAYLVDGANTTGTKEFKINSELMYISKETTDSDLILSPVYLDPEKNEEDHADILEKCLNRFGTPLREIITHKDFNWPHYSSLKQNKQGWNESFEQLQGKDNIYYSGECFSGIGVPTILEFSKRFVDSYFN